jgi:acylphosphatase
MYDDQRQAVTAEVTGAKIQRVGFRAMIQKMAIEYTRNNPNGTVEVRLQGRTSGINTLLTAMRAGSKKSSRDNSVRENAEALDPTLKTFTVVAWTSMSRDIQTPYDLTFTLRPIEGEVSRHEAKRIWNAIVLDTLQGEDRNKFLEHLERDDE